MKDIILYTKLDCHLCEEAYLVLLGLINDIPMNIKIVDITHSHNQTVQDKYGLRIPVLVQPNRADDLGWPFTASDIRGFLAG